MSIYHDYFVASQVGLSLYVSNIGSSSFIGLAGSAAASGYAVIAYEFQVGYILK